MYVCECMRVIEGEREMEKIIFVYYFPEDSILSNNIIMGENIRQNGYLEALNAIPISLKMQLQRLKTYRKQSNKSYRLVNTLYLL